MEELNQKGKTTKTKTLYTEVRQNTIKHFIFFIFSAKETTNRIEKPTQLLHMQRVRDLSDAAHKPVAVHINVEAAAEKLEHM